MVDVGVVKHARLNFLITDAPSDKSIKRFIATLQQHRCQTVVRTCEAQCDESPLEAAGISLTALEFDDGTAPPDDIVASWCALIRRTASAAEISETPSIAVHCIAGLGRSPVLVAIGLIELGVSPLDAVRRVREARPGAINQPQLRFLQTYKASRSKGCCIIQ
jgi:protein tyrosine phosphatase type 4A